MKDFFGRFVKNRGAVGGAVVLVLVIAGAAFGPLLYTADPLDMLGRPMSRPFGDFPRISSYKSK